MSDLVERAVNSGDHLEAIIKRLNGDPSVVNNPAETSDGIKKVGPYSVPEEVVSGCEAAVAAILEALRSHRRSIRPRVTGRPPEWWGDAWRVAEQHGLPPSPAKASLVDAFAILDRHVSDDTQHLAGLVFLISDLHLKIKARTTPNVFRLTGQPNTHHTVYVFDPEINGDVDSTIQEALNERVFEGQPFSAFFRAALDELETLE